MADSSKKPRIQTGAKHFRRLPCVAKNVTGFCLGEGTRTDCIQVAGQPVGGDLEQPARPEAGQEIHQSQGSRAAHLGGDSTPDACYGCTREACRDQEAELAETAKRTCAA